MSFAGLIASSTLFSSMWSGSGSWTRRPSTASSAFRPASTSSSSASLVEAGSRMSWGSKPAAAAAFCFRRM